MPAQGAGAGATIQNNQCPIIAAHFDARGVAPIVRRLWSRCGDRAPCAPKPDVHPFPLISPADIVPIRGACPEGPTMDAPRSPLR
jgi:hypothetical protein